VPLLWLQAVLGTPLADGPVIGRPGVLMLKYWDEIIVPAAARDEVQPAMQPSGR